MKYDVMTNPDMGYETPPLTDFLVANYGVFFLDADGGHPLKPGQP